MTRTDENPPGPLDLLESARAKYTLALGRLRRGPPELALLSLHGSLEDALRGYAIRHRLAAANEPFPQLLDALAADSQAHMSTAEAEIVRRMHRLRARVAHGEQITLAAGTLDAYHRLAARLLPHYDVLVVGPEDAAAAPPLARAEAEVPPRRRFDDVEAIPPRHTPDGTRTTTRLRRPPPRERTVYPDDDLARYTGRPRRNQGDYAELDSGESQFERLQRTQPWLLPLLIIVSVFLIGAAISISLQQIRAARSISLATATAFAPAVTTISPVPSVNAGATVNNVVPTLTTTVVVSPTLTVTVATPVPGVLAIGQGALVGTEIPLNLRERPGLDPNIPVLMILNPGTEVLVVEGPTSADGLSWWKVRVANLEGWCAGDYLVPR